MKEAFIMSYDFESYIDRKGTGANKWKLMQEWHDDVDEGVLPLSVADMELKSPPEIYEKLAEFLQEEPILGYTSSPAGYLKAVVDWQKERHQWDIQEEWIVSTPGVVTALNASIRAFSDAGDGVIIFKPVYYPFETAIENNKRALVNVPLLENDGDYTIDFDAFKEAARETENKILVFCSPHNPMGRVWSKEELAKLAEIAVENDLIVVSDEIWYDFTRQDREHNVLHTVNEHLQEQLITCTAASKSFNLAGAAASNIIISDPELRARFEEEVARSGYGSVNIFGYEATRLAYTYGSDWLEELLELVYDNQKMVKEFFEDHYPEIKAPMSEGTYLQWLDFRALEMNNERLDEFLHEQQFFPNPGHMFGEEGSGFQRINVALPQDALKESLYRLLSGLEERKNK